MGLHIGEVVMPWMVIRIVEETNVKNIIRNGDGLSQSEAESRLLTLQRRCPRGQRFEKLEYVAENRAAFIEQQAILEVGDFL